MLLTAMLGMRVNGHDHRLLFGSPVMPSWLDSLQIDRLPIGDGLVSLLLRRTTSTPAVEILDEQGPVTVKVIN
jgi:hypothetical protein